MPNVCLNLLLFQLRVPPELHSSGPVGYRLRHRRRKHTSDDTAKQEPVSGAARRIQRGIVSWSLEMTETRRRKWKDA